MRVYVPEPAPPEVEAFAMAKYSRSRQSLEESQHELSAQKSAEFLETFYFQYGHASIADLAHVRLAVEGISLLAAMKVVDEPLWDGQERSTRYQDYSKPVYYRPVFADGDPEVAATYDRTMHALFGAYAEVHAGLMEPLRGAYPQPEGWDEGHYTRTLRARAFDVARYLLPLGALTSLGQVTSGRVLERQISRLASDDLFEVTCVAESMRVAAQQAVPTLVKYVAPSPYRQKMRSFLSGQARLLDAPSPRWHASVRLNTDTAFIDTELSATLLYPYARGSTTYHDLLGRWYQGGHERTAFLDEVAGFRGPHDEHAREYRLGLPLVYELETDVGTFRDLHRHRRCVQVWRMPDPSLGYDSPDDFVFFYGLQRAWIDSRVARMAEVYRRAVQQAFDAYAYLEPRIGPDALYVLPMATRMRSLFKMDYAEAAYIIEVRTKPQGHFAYRRVAWDMYTLLGNSQPGFARTIRAVNPSEGDFLKR